MRHCGCCCCRRRGLACHGCHCSSCVRRARGLCRLLLSFLLLLFLSQIYPRRSRLQKFKKVRTSCQPQTGLKLSKNPTSSNKLGYSHNPGGTANIVIANRISLKIDMAKNNPIRPSMPILRYQTPSLIFIGQRGNMTIAKTIARNPPRTILAWFASPHKARQSGALLGILAAAQS